MSSSEGDSNDERLPLLQKVDSDTEASWLSGSHRVRILTCVASVAEGYDLSVIAGAIIIVSKQLNLSKFQVGLIMGIAYFAMAAGSLVAGSLMDWGGRRKVLCLSNILLAGGAFMQAFASGFSGLFFGRVLVGFGIGMGLATVSAYIAEVSPAHKRGLFSSAEEMFITIGVLCGYLANYVLLGIPHDWRWMLGLGGVIPMLFAPLLLTSLFPESPRYLFQKGRHDEASEVLSVLVSPDEAHMIMLEWKDVPAGDAANWMQVLWPESRAVRRSLFAGIFVGTAQLMCGISVVALYASLILEKEIGARSAFFQFVLIGAVRTVFCATTTTFLVDGWGRRPLLLVSSCGVTLSCLYLALAFHFKIAAIPWKVLGLYCFLLSFSVGLGPVSYTYIGETCDTDVRSKAVGFSLCLGRLIAGILLVSFPMVSGAIGVHGVFYFFTAINAGIALVFFRYIRETKLKSLESIWKQFATPRHSLASLALGGPEKDGTVPILAPGEVHIWYDAGVPNSTRSSVASSTGVI